MSSDNTPQESTTGMAGRAWKYVFAVLFLGPPALLLAAGAICLALAGYGLFAKCVPATDAIFHALDPGLVFNLDKLLPMVALVWALCGAIMEWICFFRKESPIAVSWSEFTGVFRRFIRFWGLPLVLLSFLLPVCCSWSGTANYNQAYYQTNYSQALGQIPYSDAHSYYRGACRLADAGEMDDWNTRRPINAALFCVRLGVCDLQLRPAILFQALLLGVCVFAAAWAVGAELGPWAGIGAFAVIQSFARAYVATTLSESLGISLGSLGFAALFLGARKANSWMAGTGMFGMALGLSARMGAMFMLPAFLLWIFLFLERGRGARTRAFSISLGMTLLGMGINPALNRIYGAGGDSTGANFAHTMCGLSRGTNWKEAKEFYIAELNSLATQKEQSAFLYARAWENIGRDPGVLCKSLLAGGVDFVAELPSYFIVSLCSGAWQRFAIAAVGLTCVGVLVSLFRNARRTDLWFWLAGSLGLLISTPFFFTDGGFRVLAASWPFIAALFATGLSLPKASICLKSERLVNAPVLGIGCALFLTFVTALAGPEIVHRASPKPPASGLVRAEGDGRTALIRGLPRFAAVAVTDAGCPRVPGIPTMTVAHFREFMKISSSAREEFFGGSELPCPTPFVFLCGYDFIDKSVIYAIASLETIDMSAPFLELRVIPVPGAKRLWRVIECKPAEHTGS